MAAPLVSGELSLGVLSVLDRDESALPELSAMELLAACAEQGASALGVVQAIRRARAVTAGEDPDVLALARLAALLDELEGSRAEAARALVVSLERFLRG